MSYRRAARRAVLALALFATFDDLPPAVCEIDEGDDYGWLAACLRACRWGWVGFVAIWPENENQPPVVIQCGPLVGAGQEV